MPSFDLIFALMLGLSQRGVAVDEISVDQGRLSVYHPNDGFNAGSLSCGGKLLWSSNHIAYRRWWKVGCGRPVLVCAAGTSRCAWSSVRDAGPFGIYKGSIVNCVNEGRWKVWTKSIPPAGWKWRGAADLTWALWLKLGRPRALSHIWLIFPPRKDKLAAVVR